MAGADPSFAVKEDQRSVDRQATTCDDVVGRGRGRIQKRLYETVSSDEQTCEG